MKFELASADANILGHLYRSGTSRLITDLFSKVIVDDFILQEIRNKQKEILPAIQPVNQTRRSGPPNCHFGQASHRQLKMAEQ